MRARSLGERATFVVAVIGPVIGALFLFAPLQGYCSQSIGSSFPGAIATPGPVVCGRQSLWQAQPIFPLPFLAVLVWSVAPIVVHAGARMRARLDGSAGTLLMVIGLVMAFSCIISFGGAPFFLPFVAVPTLIAAVIAFSRPAMG